MNWEQLIGPLAMLLAFKTLPFGEDPLRPWNGIGSAAFVRYENPTDTIQSVYFYAPKLGAGYHVRRVAPHTETFLKSPYTDTVVLVVVGRDTTRLRIERPGIYPLNKDKWQ